MKKVFTILITLFFLNGCVESVALLGSSVGGASSGKILQSSLNSAISYGVKHKTGKTLLFMHQKHLFDVNHASAESALTIGKI